LPNVVLRLYGRHNGEAGPGTWLQTRSSTNPEGFWNFYELRRYDYYRVIAQAPSGMIATGAWSEDGQVLANDTIEWYQPSPEIHLNKFFFDIPAATSTPTTTPTPSPSRTPTPTPTPTRTPTPTPTATPTLTPTSTPTPTTLPTFTPSPTPTATPVQTEVLNTVVEGLTSGVMFKWRTGQEPLDLLFVVERQEGTVAAFNFMSGFIPVSPEMPGQGANSAYVWLDSSAEAGVAYLYRLHILPADRYTTPVGPIARWWEHFLPMISRED